MFFFVFFLEFFPQLLICTEFSNISLFHVINTYVEQILGGMWCLQCTNERQDLPWFNSHFSPKSCWSVDDMQEKVVSKPQRAWSSLSYMMSGPIFYRNRNTVKRFQPFTTHKFFLLPNREKQKWKPAVLWLVPLCDTLSTHPRWGVLCCFVLGFFFFKSYVKLDSFQFERKYTCSIKRFPHK